MHVIDHNTPTTRAHCNASCIQVPTCHLHRNGAFTSMPSSATTPPCAMLQSLAAAPANPSCCWARYFTAREARIAAPIGSTPSSMVNCELRGMTTASYFEQAGHALLSPLQRLLLGVQGPPASPSMASARDCGQRKQPGHPAAVASDMHPIWSQALVSRSQAVRQQSRQTCFS